MGTDDGLLRVVWPSESIKPDVTGVLVGWRNSDQDIFIAAILRDTEARAVETTLRVGSLFRNSKHPIQSLLQCCGGAPLQVVGTINPSPPPLSFSPNHIFAYSKSSSSVPSIYCPNITGLTVQLILYDRPLPSKMQFMSLEPMSLALDDKLEHKIGSFSSTPDADRYERKEEKNRAALVEKLKFHTINSYTSTDKEIALSLIIDQINCSWEINQVVQQNIGLVRTRRRRQLSVSERVVESASDLWDYTRSGIWYTFRHLLYPVIVRLFIVGLLAHRVAAELILSFVEWRLRPQDAALKDISATAQQVDLRLQQFCYWPLQYLTLRERKDAWESITNSHPEYIRFYNSLWLVANDVIMGIAIGSYIIENADLVAASTDRLVTTCSLNGLRRMIIWLMAYPGGLKLNNELAGFLGDLFIWVIDYWAGCIAALQPSLPTVVRFIGFASFAGATMPLSLADDFLSLLTLHIHCFYIASARIYSWQLSIITSLFHLFRGKKRNVLRNRIDSCDYELDQLLLGTILFTLLFFLLPTVIVFYLTFAFARMAIISLKAILDTMLACLNHFPLFALMLRIKDSGRLPGGVRFELKRSYGQNASNLDHPKSIACITIKSIPLPLRAIFHEYSQLGSRIRKHYLSFSVFFCLATGQFVPPLHRKNLYGLQYSMLPAQRIGIAELAVRLRWSQPSSSTTPGGLRKVINANGHRR